MRGNKTDGYLINGWIAVGFLRCIFSCYPSSSSVLFSFILPLPFPLLSSVGLTNPVGYNHGFVCSSESLRPNSQAEGKRRKTKGSIRPDVSRAVLFSPLMVSRAITDAALLSAICYSTMVAVSNQEQNTHTHIQTHTHLPAR